MAPAIELFGMKIFVFPLILLLAIFVCLLVYIVNEKYDIRYISTFLKCFVVVLVWAAIFGRLLSALTLLQTSDNSFTYNLLNGGFVFYGGVIGGLISGRIFCIVTNESFLDLSDILFSLLPLGHAIGRIGCYFNGCCYGHTYNGFLSVPYIVNGVKTSVFPTWFVESFFCLLLAIYFQMFCRKTKRGFQTTIYLLAYSSFRFIIEFFRGDDIRGVFGEFSTSQFISIVFFVGCILTLKYVRSSSEENKLLNQRGALYEL